MKAININNQVKTFGKLPSVWGNVINLPKASDELLKALGFYDIESPTITEHQRYGGLTPSDFDAVNEVWVKPIIDFTQDEIDAYEKSKEDSDASAQKVSNFKADGQTEHKRIWDKIMRLYDNGQLNDTQFNAISDLLFDALLPLELGLWKVAQSRVDALPVGTGILATIRTTVKGIIDDYVIANY